MIRLAGKAVTSGHPAPMHDAIRGDIIPLPVLEPHLSGRRLRCDVESLRDVASDPAAPHTAPDMRTEAVRRLYGRVGRALRRHAFLRLKRAGPPETLSGPRVPVIRDDRRTGPFV